MNIIRFSIQSIRKAGLGRFLAIIAAKSYRRLREGKIDNHTRTVLQIETVGFNGILPLEASTGARFKKEFPDSFASLLASAQKIRLHEFELLGYTVRFDKNVQWHRDPASNTEWRKQVYKEVGLHYEGSPADVKPVWELNRHQYFVTLALAFYLSGDRAHFDELIAQWLNWIEENPYRIGINWTSPLEIGVRLISWTLAFQLVEAHLSKRDRTIITRSVWQQLSFLSTHLSTDKVVRTNHLIGEATGLYVVASSFEFQESDRWAIQAERILEKEVQSQIFSDGVAREQSSSYHLFDVDFFLLAHLKALRRHQSFSPQYKERLLQSIRYLNCVETPDHRLPQLGDNDDGRGFTLLGAHSAGIPSGVIGIGGAVFHDKQLCAPEHFNEESFWLLTEAERKLAASHGNDRRISPLTILDRSGHVIIRNDRQENGDYCFFRAGEFGSGGEGYSSHSHNDLFSPIIYVDGNLILTDTGTSTYLGNDNERDYLRSAAAHNSTFAASWDFFQTERWFGWKKCVDGIILNSVQAADEVRVECGYKPSRKVPYKRTIAYSPGLRQFKIEDLFGDSTHDVHTRFHLDSSLNIRIQKNEMLILKKDAIIARCIFPSNLHLTVEEGWVSRRYGVKEPSVILHFSWNAVADVPVIFTFTVQKP